MNWSFFYKSRGTVLFDYNSIQKAFKKIKENNKNKWEWSKRTVPHGCLVVKEFKLTSYFRDAGLGDGVIESISNIEKLMQMYNA